MRPIPTKVTGDQAFADEYTSMSQEEINFVLLSSQNLNALDDNQLSRGACNYTSQADYYTTTGSSPNTYLATPPSPILGVSTSTYLDGQRFRINITATNTGPSTLSIQSIGNPLGQVTIRKGLNFNELEGGELVSGFTCEVIYVQAQSAFLLVNNGFSNIVPTGNGVSFFANQTAEQALTDSSVGAGVVTYDTVIFDSVDFNYTPDPGTNGYIVGTGEFIAPISGLYEFTVMNSARRFNNSGSPQTELLRYIFHSSILVNGVVRCFGYSADAQYITTTISDGSFSISATVNSYLSVELSKGDVVTNGVQCSTSNGDVVNYPAFTYSSIGRSVNFSGRLIRAY